MGGDYIPKILIWFAKIQNRTNEMYSRKIKIYAMTEKSAVRQAKEFCCPDEVLLWVCNEENVEVWRSEK